MEPFSEHLAIPLYQVSAILPQLPKALGIGYGVYRLGEELHLSSHSGSDHAGYRPSSYPSTGITHARPCNSSPIAP